MNSMNHRYFPGHWSRRTFFDHIFVASLLLGPTLMASISAGPIRPDGAVATIPYCTPIGFIANQGQADPRYSYLAQSMSYCLGLSAHETVVQWPNHDILRIQLLNHNPDVEIKGLAPQTTQTHFLLGSNPDRWLHNIRRYAQVKWEGVYTGIDLILYGQQDRLEYDFVVAPGADPNQIRLSFDGAQAIEMDASGTLRIRSTAGQLIQSPPRAYQVIHGRRQPVAARLVLEPAIGIPTEVGLVLGAYDADIPLVIDPELDFSTFLGAAGDDRAYSVAVDAADHLYIVGQTTSPDFPMANPLNRELGGGTDVFITKYDTVAKTVLFSTFIGGNGHDKGCSVAIDSAGNAIVAGITLSTNFPTVKAYQDQFGGGDRDGFVLKLSASGTQLVFSSYLGGRDSDDALGVATGPGDIISVVGDTASPDFPLQSPFQAVPGGHFDGFVAQFNRDGFLNYSTFLGGNGPYDGVASVVLDDAANTYVAGFTSSANFPVSHPFQASYQGGYDAFVVKINPKGNQLLFSSFLGGTGDDTARSIGLDADGNVYVAGDTVSVDFPTINPLQPVLHGRRDLFIAKINATGSNVLFATYLGGDGEEMGALAVDPFHCVHVAGITSSTNFPVLNAIQNEFGGGYWDAFIAKLNPEGSGLVYASYFGGNAVDQGSAIAVDENGGAYIVGASASQNLPTLNPLHSKHRGGGYDAFMAKVTEKAVESIEAPATEIAQDQTPAVAVTEQKPAATQPAQTAVAPTPPDKAVAEASPAATAEVSLESLLKHPIFGRNLVLNSGAESGAAARSSYGKTDIPGWKADGNLIVLQYATPGGFPTTNSPGPSDRGTNFFAGGPDNATSAISQSFDLREIAPLIDAHRVTYKFGAFLGGVGGQKDQAVFHLVFKDTDDGFLGQMTVGPVTMFDRQYKTAMLWRSNTGQVPTQTRKLEVRLQMNRVDGAYNDAFADNLGLLLMPSARP